MLSYRSRGEAEMKRLSQERSYFVAKDNQLITKSRYSLSMAQQKILLYFISRIKPYDDENTLYEFKIKDFIQVCGYYDDTSYYYTQIKKDIKELADASSWIEIEKGKEVLFRWINEAEIEKNNGVIRISFHKTVIKYLFDLRDRYTQYSLYNVLCLSHKYSIRLYEYLRMMEYRGEFQITIEELKRRIDAEKYSAISNFTARVLDPAIEDINDHTDLFVWYEFQKTDRRITHITFYYGDKSSFDMSITGKRQERKINPLKRLESKKKIAQAKEELQKSKE